MLEKLTEAAQKTITASNRYAREAGHANVDGVDFLVGLTLSGGIAAAVLADLGIGPEDVQRALAAQPSEQALDPDLLPQLTDEVRTAIREAVKLAAEVGHDAVDTGHLLLALTFPQQSAGRTALAAFGTAAEALRDAVTARHPAGVPLGPEGAPAGPHGVLIGWNTVWSNPPQRLPTRATTFRGALILVTLYALFGAALISAASTHTRSLTEVVLVAAPTLGGTLRIAVRPQRIARAVGAIRALPGGRFPAPDSLAELTTRRFSEMTVQIVVEDELVKSRLKRDRNRAWIVIAAVHAVQPPVRRFVTLHETAHLLRGDSIRYELTQIFAVTLAETALITLSPPGLTIGLAGALLIHLTGRWPAELACDTLAARWSGNDAMTAWDRLSTHVHELPANRTPRRRIRRATLGWLNHPPRKWRLAWVRLLTARHTGGVTAPAVLEGADV